VRRNGPIGLMALLAGMMLFGAVAGAAGNVAPTRVTAKVRPLHTAGPPYTFTTSGKIVRPSVTICPKGTTNPAYCEQVPAGTCSGTVRITIEMGIDLLLADAGTTLHTSKVRLRSNCTYSSTTKLRKGQFTAGLPVGRHEIGRYARLTFVVRYLGNSVLSAENGPNRTVIAQVISG
jgi:hypothetical protein